MKLSKRAAALAAAVAALTVSVPAQSPAAWELVGNAAVSTNWGNSGFMKLDPETQQPFFVFQESTQPQSVGRVFQNGAWTVLPGPVSYGTGWYHVTAFGYAPGASRRTPFVFLRDYGWAVGSLPSGDGTLAYWSESGGTGQWVRAQQPATPAESHYLWLDIETSNSASPMFNLPVVSFANREFNTSYPANPLLVECDWLTVALVDVNAATGEIGYRRIGTGGIPGPARLALPGGGSAPIGPVKFTTVRVTPAGAILVAYVQLSPTGALEHANVVRYDAAADLFVPFGQPDFSQVTIDGTPIVSVSNLTLTLDGTGAPWAAFLYLNQIVVMRFDASNQTWNPVGGFASGPDVAMLPDNPERYRVGLAVDSDFRPYVLYALWSLTPVQDAKAVVRAFENGTWEAVGDVGFTPYGASCFTLEVDAYDDVYAGLRNLFTGRMRVMRYVNPLIQGGPRSLPAGGSTLASFASPVIGAAVNPRGADVWTLQVSQAAPDAFGLLLFGEPLRLPYTVPVLGWQWYADPAATFLIANFRCDAAGSAALNFQLPAGVPALDLVFGALVHDTVNLAMSNALKVYLLPAGWTP